MNARDGSRPPGSPRVVVVGGGVSGLAAAQRVIELARERGVACEVRVVEASSRVGGVIETVREEGLLLELGPDTLLDAPAAALDLCRRLGLGDALVDLGARAGGYPVPSVLRDGEVVPLPCGMTAAGGAEPLATLGSPLLSAAGRFRAVLEPIVPRRDPADDAREESLAAFVRRRAGQEVAERVADPLVAGLFLGDAERLSAALTLPRLIEAERQLGSVTRGLRAARSRHGERAAKPGASGARGGAGIFTLARGLDTLPAALVRALPDGAVRLGAEVAAIDRLADGEWRVRLADGREERGDALVLALPAAAAARVVEGVSPELAAEGRRAEAASCATVALAYPASRVTRLPAGFGFFVPRSAERPLVACSVVSRKLPERAPEGVVLLRAYLGGAGRDAVLALDDARLAQLAHDELAPIVGLEGQPAHSRVARFVRGMPQPVVGEAARRARVTALCRELPGLVPAGGLLGAVGIPSCVALGESAGAAALDHALSRADRARQASEGAA